MADITVVLPDGSSRILQSGSTVRDLAASIGAGLAKAAIAGKVNNELVDLSAASCPTAQLWRSSPKRAPKLWKSSRHSTSHLMAQAVKALFPQAKVTIGPAIETGFYYDFDVDHPFTPEDLEKIEKKMQELAKACSAD